jgi:hypothetical protein
MSFDQGVQNLTFPRYVPFLTRGTALAAWYDNMENQYIAVCPKCHSSITYDSLTILYRELVIGDAKCCQGCRAKITFERNPGLIGLFLDFWYRTGSFPKSSSWMEAIPQHLFNLWPKELKAAMEAEAHL